MDNDIASELVKQAFLAALFKKKAPKASGFVPKFKGHNAAVAKATGPAKAVDARGVTTTSAWNPMSQTVKRQRYIELDKVGAIVGMCKAAGLDDDAIADMLKSAGLMDVLKMPVGEAAKKGVRAVKKVVSDSVVVAPKAPARPARVRPSQRIGARTSYAGGMA